MKKLVSFILCFALMVSLVACGGTTGESDEFTPVADGATVGEGAVSFPLVIVDKEGTEIKVTVNTDAETVGDALVETGLVEGSDGEYGLYITHVNGIAAVYEEDGTYWAFYVNDEYAQAGVDSTPITEREAYMLKAES